MFLRQTRRKKDGKTHSYWSVVENHRLGTGRVVQRHVLYLGEISPSQAAAWRKSIELFDKGAGHSRTLALFPEDRATTAASDNSVVQLRLSEMRLCRARQWGACWLAGQLWSELQLDRFWADRLPTSRKRTRWGQVLQVLVPYRLIAPGSEWKLRREWFGRSAMADLLGSDFAWPSRINSTPAMTSCWRWPSYCRATPELVRLQAHLSALTTYRTAAGLLEQLFSVNAAKHHETERRHALKVGEVLQDCAATTPGTMASAVVVTLDSTFIRSCENGERHLEVRVGNVETKSGGRQVFGSVGKAETDIKVLINRNLDAVGRTEHTALTAFTDGCPGLRRILADAGVTTAPFLDWFHTGMRLQHLKRVASGLSCDDPLRAAAKAVIIAEVERLHWRPWNGKAANARISIDRIHAVMHHFEGEPGTRKSIAPSRKLWTALRAHWTIT